MIDGLNHITFSVLSLENSMAFYVDLLGFSCRHIGRTDCHLSSGDLWFCLVEDADASPSPDYSHVAFHIDLENFDAFADKLRAAGIREWQENKTPGKSIYFLDPDGRKLEVHCGNLDQRLVYSEQQKT